MVETEKKSNREKRGKNEEDDYKSLFFNYQTIIAN